jgi:hypothetical protein
MNWVSEYFLDGTAETKGLCWHKMGWAIEKFSTAHLAWSEAESTKG